MVFIEDNLEKNIDEIAPYTQLRCIQKYYESRLFNLNPNACKVHSTRLKEKILGLNENLQAISNKKRCSYFV